jgi:SNF2 family DNA or RNA helicase
MYTVSHLPHAAASASAAAALPFLQVDAGALSDAHYLLRPFCLRRIKDEVEVALPPKVETRIAVPLSDQQTFWYRRWAGLQVYVQTLCKSSVPVTKGCNLQSVASTQKFRVFEVEAC